MNFPQNQEIWRAIDGFINYEISSHGRVRNAKRGKMITQQTTHDGYKRVGLRKNNAQINHSVHRLVACAFIENHENKECIDHMNGNRSDNTMLNLRWASCAENSANTKKRANTTSIYKGVCYNKRKRKWKAGIREDGKNIHLGYFTNEKDAGKAYNEKALEVFGEFAKPNEISDDDE